MHIAEEPESPNIHLLQAHFHKAAAGIDVVVGQLLLDLGDTQSVRHQLVGIHPHLILTYRAPEVGNVHHIGDRLELLEQNKIFERPQFHQVVAGICASQCVPIDLARGTPVGTDLRLKILSRGESDLGEPFQHLLAVPVVHGTVVEDHDDERQTENRLGAQISHVRHSGHFDLDRNRDLLFHLFRGTAGPLRNNCDVVVGDIGIGLHRQVME